MDIKVLVAVHKKFWVPDDPMYLPVQVGSALAEKELDFQRDDIGDNISAKNGKYCELTGIYWAWKNLDADYIGLVHYRRYFTNRKSFYWLKNDKRDNILSRNQAEKLLRKVDVILPRKRNYYIETLYDHYSHTHDGKHLDMTRDIIARNCPDYLDDFDKVMQRKSAHMFNMFIMSRQRFHAYCQWVFTILGELEQIVDTSSMNTFESRYLGRISELLLDVWMEKNQIVYEEVPFVQLGKVNWLKKISSFLKAKYKNEKYKQSF